MSSIDNPNIIDQFHLRDLNPIYGRETFYRKGEDSVSLGFVIYPCEDLCINSNTDVDLVLPINYHIRGGLTIIPRQPHVFAHSEYFRPENNELFFPWLQSARYPLGVWFFTIRNTLRKECSPWVTPFEVCRSLPIPSRRIGGQNSQLVTMTSGAGRTRGRRSYMEDVDFAFDSIRVADRNIVGAYGVLDGHGGRECAQFAVDEIPMKVTAFLRSGKPCNEALYSSFLSADAEFLRSGRSNAGSTACVLIWEQRTGTAMIANTGDTRAVLCRSGRAIDLTIDKKATSHDEIARITKEGGFVVNGRVMGSLAVSRALGDSQLKIPGKRVLIPDPEVTSFRPNAVETTSGGLEIDEFVIIATDGLWDVMTSQAAVDFVRDQMQRSNLLPVDNGGFNGDVSLELNRISELVANHAVKTLQSLDNVTVMIIRISIGNINGIIPEDVQLEGWQRENVGISLPQPSASAKTYLPVKELTSFRGGGGAGGSGGVGAVGFDDSKLFVDEFINVGGGSGGGGGGGGGGRREVEEKKKDNKEDDDDLLNYLLDDNNF